jgi:hypothetical protein
MDREHKTERGALLDALEHRCIRSGEWEVEGFRVIRVKSLLGGGVFWTATRPVERGDETTHVDFTAALRWIASKVAS